ncbi:MAG: hypothetical protein NC409_12590 [Clostridium sp.]|nr:hypothetical protein [Clostridium sp.]
MINIEELSVRIPEAGEPVLRQAAADAAGAIMDICNRTSIPPSMDNLHLSLAEIYARRIMAAGEESRSEGDVRISNAYTKEIPQDLMKRLLARRKLKQAVVRHETEA